MIAKLRPLALTLVLLSLLVTITSVNRVSATPSADANAQQRVIVYFNPGSKGSVMRTLQSAKGQVHHEFDVSISGRCHVKVRTIRDLTVTSAVISKPPPVSSPSPIEAWTSPTARSAPGTCTGR